MQILIFLLLVIATGLFWGKHIEINGLTFLFTVALAFVSYVAGMRDHVKLMLNQSKFLTEMQKHERSQADQIPRSDSADSDSQS